VVRAAEELGEDMRRSLRVVISAASIVALLVLGGCSSSDDSGSASASPTVSPAAAWAESVCTAVDGLRTSVTSLGSNLTIGPSPSAGALDELKAQLETQLASIAASVDELTTAVAAVPTDLPGAEQAKASLAASANTFKAGVQTLTQQGQALASATAGSQAALLAGQALGALQAVVDSAGTLATNFATAVDQAGGELKAAFAAAPSCNQLTASPAPSGS
jgi:hypothetical protein